MSHPKFREGAVFGAAFLVAAAAFAQPKVEEVVLGPLMNHFSGHVLAPRGVRLATIAAKGEGAVIFVDGVEGPALDQVVDSSFVGVSLSPEQNEERNLKELNDRDNKQTTQIVLFSEDGARYAYVGLIGAEFVVIADGKEVFRVPTEGYAGICGMRFSPGGKHLVFALNPNTSGPGHGFRLVVDGKASDLSYLQPLPVFSPDGEHYAYVATDTTRTEQHALMIDGRPASYKGVRPQFDAQGRLFSVAVDPETSKETLQLDGKPWFTAHRVGGVFPAPVGARSAAIGHMGSQRVELFIDGVSVTVAENIESVHWSPNGTRCAALCTTRNHTRYVVLDGVNGPELANITDIAFAPDSSRLVYVGFDSGQHHVVFDNQNVMEGAPTIPVKPFFYGPKHEVAFVQSRNRNDMALIVGDQMFGRMVNLTGVAASPDGSRVAFAHGNPNTMSVVIGDMEYSGFQPAPFTGSPLDTASPPPWFAFSPDGKHVARVVMSREPRGPMGVMVDETLIPTRSTRIIRPRFTPDSLHLYWVEGEKPYYNVYLDGEVAARYDISPSWSWDGSDLACAMEPDGTLVIMGPVGGEVKRFRITPSSATSIDTMIEKAKG
ncbi:MAG: hypothetical protein ACKVU4_03530 [Phycisphaerales bacterium]